MLNHHFCYGSTQASEYTMFLHGDNTSRFPGCGDDRFLIKWLDGVHIENTSFHTHLLEQLSRIENDTDGLTSANQSNV
ncbi:hypothetical protein D3C74_461140 [compost metagenome]